MKKIVLLMILIFNFWACQSDGVRIDKELVEYIEVFESEASNRGIEISVEGLDVTAHFMNIRETNILGQCFTFSDDSRQIIIDRNTWIELDELEKEFLMMHELGHCVLNRGHIDDRYNNNECVSIMQSGTGNCSYRYDQNNREELLDELFKY